MSPLDPKQHNIALIVDDSPETLNMVSTALEDHGITTLVARDGLTAIDLARRIEPDVILMDAIMPQMDGFETCRQLKSGLSPVVAPIIFMTGLSDSEHLVHALQSGGVDYIRKPVVIEELIARITTHVLNAKLIRSAQEALDTSGRSIVAFDAEGQILWGSPKALQQLAEAPNQSILQQQDFRRWLHHCKTLPASHIEPFDFDDYALVFIGTTSSSEVLVKLTLRNCGTPMTILAKAFALTTREAEILYWLSLGKTNQDIGQILGLSGRTVNKHLEKVFQKMDVYNRTSAAVKADRLLHLEA